MSERRIEERMLRSFRTALATEERAVSTIEKYVGEVRRFRTWLDGRGVTAELVSGWKKQLSGAGYRAETVNGKVSAVNKFLEYMGWGDCRARYLKIQRRLFRGAEKELSRTEYVRLVETAQGRGQRRLALVMETMCATGIRVSEVRYITVESVERGRAEVALKGKIRTILLPGKLCRKLAKYAKKEKIASGEIFLTRSGRGISRRQIWSEMKRLCAWAGVAATKVFPHNLRHLFARTFYRRSRDVTRLADVLGHSSIETTRIYLISTGWEHCRELEQLGLIS